MIDHSRCKGYIPSFHDEHHVTCLRGSNDTFKLANAHDVSRADCILCSHFKSRYIEYPITVDNIQVQPLESFHSQHRLPGMPVAVRPVDDKTTYLGFYLGELPWMHTVSYDETKHEITVGAANNPCILVPQLHKLVFGAESWWHPLESPEDLKEISDTVIQNQWYVQMAQDLMTQSMNTTTATHGDTA